MKAATKYRICMGICLGLLAAVFLLVEQCAKPKTTVWANEDYQVEVTIQQWKEYREGKFEDLDELTRYYGIQRNYYSLNSEDPNRKE